MNLTIVTSCSGYGKYLDDWARSIVALQSKPARVCIFTHGADTERTYGAHAVLIVRAARIPAEHQHESTRLDFGTARNRAVAMSATEWVMHLDADDTLMPHALEDVAALADSADVVCLGYERTGDLAAGPANPRRIYSNTTGLQALEAAAPASGVSPFRRTFWERSPYRTDMRGAWDTALWIGFARLGARFRATKRPCFWYRQHADSIFNRRRLTLDWTHQLTTTHLAQLRANYSGTAVIVPRDTGADGDRVAAWAHVRTHYKRAHPDWPIIEGFSAAEAWCKADAIADALRRCTAATLVIADADCLVSPDALRSAVDAVESRRAPWVVPHTLVHRLTREATRRFVDGEQATDLARPAYHGFAGGGVFVVSRLAYDATGGIPRAFRGWGSEDEAFAVILDCLIGPHERGDADLIHLWHEPQRTKVAATSGPTWKASNRQALLRVSNAAKRGQDALWQTLRELRWTEPQIPRRRTPAQNAERRHRQSFLAGQQRRA